VLKNVASYAVPGMTNENQQKYLRIAGLWVDMRPHKYEAEVLTTQSSHLIK
jgi:hypothetical protein